MPSDAQRLIQDLVGSELIRSTHTSDATKPVITLSRDFGSGGNIIARCLADRLGVEMFDRHILDAVSEGAKVDARLMEELDERVRSRKDAWIYNLLSGTDAFVTSYRHHLVNVSLGLAQKGGVIVGRGVHLILANRRVFRVRIVGTPEICAQRVAEREEIPYEMALIKVNKVNKERGEYLWSLFNRRHSEAHSFDLIINSDRMNDWDAMADLIISAMKSYRHTDPVLGSPHHG